MARSIRGLRGAAHALFGYPRAQRMEVASLCSLPVGVLAWESTEPATTVIIKATFAIDEDGEARLAERQEPLSLDRDSTLGDADELDYASDFVPKKARCDVLLVGHAHTDAPFARIQSMLTVDGFERRFDVVTDEPALRIPLVMEHLREGGSGEPTAVGPLAPWAPERADRGVESFLDESSEPVVPLTDGFDFAFFNAAPRAQQVGAIAPSASLTLDGLLRGAPARDVRLPGLFPRVFAIDAAGAATAVDMRCDTLWIDTDRQILTLTFRAVVLGADAVVRLVVALASPSEDPTWETIAPRLAEAATASPIRAADIRAAEAIPEGRAAPHFSPMREGDPATLALDTLTATTFVDEDDEEQTVAQIVAHDEPSLIEPTLPFAPGVLVDPLPSSGAWAEHVDTGTLALGPDGLIAKELTLAIDGPVETAAPLPFAERLEEGTITLTEVPAEARLPFVSRQIEARVAPSHPSPPTANAPLAALSFAQRAEDAKVLGVAPDEAPGPEAKATEGEDALLPVETYAAVHAAVRGGKPLDEALAPFGIDEAAWHKNQRRQTLALAEESGRGGCEAALALFDAMVSAARRASPSEGGRSVDEHVALRAEIESLADPSGVLAREGLSAAAWKQEIARFRERAMIDGKLAKELRSKLSAARKTRKRAPANDRDALLAERLEASGVALG